MGQETRTTEPQRTAARPLPEGCNMIKFYVKKVGWFEHRVFVDFHGLGWEYVVTRRTAWGARRTVSRLQARYLRGEL